MLERVTGKIRAKHPKAVVLAVGDFDLRLTLPLGEIEHLPPPGETVSLFTFLHLREDGLDLYGFHKEAALRLFELLLTVNGVGPRSAIGILGVAPVEQLTTAIASGDPGLLQRSSGVGRKTAERITLELKDKIGSAGAAAEMKEALEVDDDVIEALAGLGYPKLKAKEAVGRLSPEIKNAGDRLREALRLLGQRNHANR